MEPVSFIPVVLHYKTQQIWRGHAMPPALIASRASNPWQCIADDLALLASPRDAVHRRWVLDLLFETSVRLLFSAATDRTVGVWGDRGQQLQVPHAHLAVRLLLHGRKLGQPLLGAHATALLADILLTSQPTWLKASSGIHIAQRLPQRDSLSRQSQGQRCAAGGAVRRLGARAGVEPAAAAAGGGPEGAGGPVHGARLAPAGLGFGFNVLGRVLPR